MFLLFSGHNDRAVIALCRFFYSHNINFAIVATALNDVIFKTSWRNKVIFTRIDKHLDLNLFMQIKLAADAVCGKNKNLIYCPTTEFINQFALENRNVLENIGITMNMPSQSVYSDFTSKQKSAALINEIINIKSPPVIRYQDAHYPCVFKPNINIKDGIVLYPIICLNHEELLKAKKQTNATDWIVQKYILGQSYYLCGYLSKNGCYESYWQINMMQQANGKSIVLARVDRNPGIDVDRFFKGIFERGYFGLMMMEIMIDENNNIFYIEINPRFWGPLQLALDVNPGVLELFVRDSGINIEKKPILQKEICWYAWLNGSKQPNNRIYPALADYSESKIDEMLNVNDIYFGNDTIELHGNN